MTRTRLTTPPAPPRGYLCLVLHAHLPFVRHPENDTFLEENWLFEAITDTYIPLLSAFEALARDKVPFRITMSLTPTLAEMLQDSLLQERYLRRVSRLIELAGKEMERTRADPAIRALARRYHRQFTETRRLFTGRYDCNLVNGFRRMARAGRLEIIASCATHGFLPNLAATPASLRAQVMLGIDYHRRLFGSAARGFWLPECGYFPGLDATLREAGVTYTFLDSHGILNSRPAPRYSVYAPLYTPAGTAVFGRDWESSKQVWSSTEGYPGDPDYREYYRDIGHDLDIEYLRPYIHPAGIRVNTGLKYCRVTGKTDRKETYRPDVAQRRAAAHAAHFVQQRLRQAEALGARMDRAPVIVAPYDAELFGHWWYEGPAWIERVARAVAATRGRIAMATPSDYLARYPVNQAATPSASSWGWKGYSEYWLESSNDWIYRHLHAAGRHMAALARGEGRRRSRSPLRRRALNQAARELLLAEASDWPFIMKSGTMVPYAHRRIKLHLARFNRLHRDLRSGTIDGRWLTEVERRDTIFKGMDCVRYYRAPARGPGPRARR